jgi:hypothetical protein
VLDYCIIEVRGAALFWKRSLARHACPDSPADVPLVLGRAALW